jgi:hypothetical protein
MEWLSVPDRSSPAPPAASLNQSAAVSIAWQSCEWRRLEQKECVRRDGPDRIGATLGLFHLMNEPFADLDGVVWFKDRDDIGPKSIGWSLTVQSMGFLIWGPGGQSPMQQQATLSIQLHLPASSSTSSSTSSSLSFSLSSYGMWRL